MKMEFLSARPGDALLHNRFLIVWVTLFILLVAGSITVVRVLDDSQIRQQHNVPADRTDLN